jgi:hypothetical protein
MFRFKPGSARVAAAHQASLALHAARLPRFPEAFCLRGLGLGLRGPGEPDGFRGWRPIWLAASVGFSHECDSLSDLLAFIQLR